MGPSIFISYRRDDAAGDAGRLADHLHRRFGPGRVFVDVDTIEPGTDFVAALHGSLEQTAVLLVVIGPRWVSLRAADGTRRLDDPNDFVRLEVETALGRAIPVVPVLVQGATLPRADEIPASLAPLVRRQVVELDHAEFHADAERLCDWLTRTIEPGGIRRPLVRRWWPATATAAIIALALGFAAYRLQRDDGVAPTSAPNATGDRATTDVGRKTPVPPPGVVPTAAPEPSANAPNATLGAKPISGSTTSPATDRSAGSPADDRSARAETTRRVDALIAEATAQRRRSQFVEALATLARARELSPDSEPVRELQEDVALHWIRNVRFESGKSSFTDAIKPALAVVDAALPSAKGPRRADLLAHSGWAAFLMWRDGNRQANPTEFHEEALGVDPVNPYANAMLAHWLLFRGTDVSRAAKLFDTALQSGRATDAIRSLQWAAYRNASTPAAHAQLVRLADAMRRDGKKLSMDEAQTLWSPYYVAAHVSRETERTSLLDAVPPDDHLATLEWALDEYVQADPSRRPIVRYYVALLHARAGRPERAADELRALLRDLGKNPGSLRDAVEAALSQLQRRK